MMLDRCRHDEDIVGGDTLDFELAPADRAHQGAGSALGDRADVLPPAATAHGDDAGRAGAAGGGARRRGGAGRAPPRLPDRRRQRDPGPGAARDRAALPAVRRRRDLTEDLVDGELVYRPFSETVFLDDLRTARGVIAGAASPCSPSASTCTSRRSPSLSPASSSRRSTRATWNGSATASTRRRRRRRPSAGSSSACPSTKRALAGYAQDGNHEALAALREQLALVALERAGKRTRRTRPASGVEPVESGESTGADDSFGAPA